MQERHQHYRHSIEELCLFRLAAISLTLFFSRDPVVRLCGSSRSISNGPESSALISASPESGVFVWNAERTLSTSNLSNFRSVCGSVSHCLAITVLKNKKKYVDFTWDVPLLLEFSETTVNSLGFSAKTDHGRGFGAIGGADFNFDALLPEIRRKLC